MARSHLHPPGEFTLRSHVVLSDRCSIRSNYPTLAGNLAAIMTGLIVSVVVSLIKPDDFDWEATRAINAESAHLEGVETATKHHAVPTASGEKDIVAKDASPDSSEPDTPDDEENATVQRTSSRDSVIEDNPSQLRSAFKVACIASFVLPFIMDFLIPIPMFLTHYVFSKGFFTAWIVLSFIWVFSSAFISVCLPIWEARSFFKDLYSKIVLDVRGREN